MMETPYTFAEAIMEAAEYSGVSPFYIASRVLMEQGSSDRPYPAVHTRAMKESIISSISEPIRQMAMDRSQMDFVTRPPAAAI